MKVIQSQWDWEYTGVSKNLSANYIKKHYLLSSFGKLDSKKSLCAMSIPRDAQKQIGKRERSICDKKKLWEIFLKLWDHQTNKVTLTFFIQ